MSDILSQEQIDALLQSQDGEGGVGAIESDEGNGESGGGTDYEALKTALQIFCEQAGSVISTVLNREVKWKTEEGETTDPAKLKESVEAPQLILTLSFEEGLQGQFHLIIGTKEVALLSDLMMMGDGNAEYTEDHKDAITELLNQVMGACATSYGEQIGNTVTVGMVQVAELDIDNPPIPLEDTATVMVTVSVTDFENAAVGIVVTPDLAAQFNEYFGQRSHGKGDPGDGGSMGLSAAELEDLANVTSDPGDGESDGGFTEMFRSDSAGGSHPKENIDMLLDVELDVQIELGRADLAIKRILELAPGSVVELDRMAGEPVDLLVNNKVVAKGEVVVVDENFGIRIVSLVSPEDRIRSLR
ncbi:MAG: flagellar motor switch protein FliN [Chitinivibrionales bacterium]|nr:flagellar motor switch protein FliN [Chitinivibrionales bacterium]MBD3356658.1 flagellar motor switch protein FliN [Chitinivibrionales bacterium]